MDAMQKRLAGVAAVAVILVGSVVYLTFRPATAQLPESSVREKGKNLKPGTAGVEDPYYQDELRRFNEEQADRALRMGRSSVPLMNPAPVSQQQPGAPVPMANAQQPQAQPQIDANLIGAKAAWMKGYLDEQKASELRVSSIQAPSFEQAKAADTTGATAPSSSSGPTGTAIAPTLIAGGTSAPGVLEASLDTDIPVEAFAQIVDGPFSGAQLDGKIARVNDYIRLSFQSMHFNGKTYAVNAVGLDPETGRAVLAGEVDNKWMERFGWPFLVGLVRGAAQVAAQPDATVTVSQGSVATQTDTSNKSRQILGGAVADGTNAIATGLAAEGRVEKAVRWDVKQPIVIRFLSEVKETNR